jgi:DNA (cytosine-5)-methyltransferase 1
MPLSVGSLFSGIGGFDLGLERAGMRTMWFCEQDDYCRRVLAKHWPGVPCYPDVRALVADAGSHGRDRRPRQQDNGPATLIGRKEGDYARDSGKASPGIGVPLPVPYVDVLVGGFPCQDLSNAGKGAGLDGERSGLWSEYARLIRELRPRYVVVENVSALLARGMGRVLGDLAACGYDAEWDCIPASAVGAPHRRDRVWIIAYPNGDDGGPGRPGRLVAGGAREPEPVGSLQDAAREVGGATRPGAAGVGSHAAYPAEPRLEGHRGDAGQPEVPEPRHGRSLADADEERRGRRAGQQRPGRRGEPTDGSWWAIEPDVGRVAHGVPARVDRLRALGNALVPQIAEWLGHRIIEWEGLT